MRITTCPDRESLARYVIGKLTVEELETVADHVDGCPACQSTVEGLDGLSDTVLSELRQPATEDTVENETACQEMVARVLASGPAVADADRALTADGSTPAVQARAPEATTALTDEPLPQAIGRYRILEQLGRGGMGTVYKAHDPQLDRVVALKMPRFDRAARDRATAMQRFLREARAAASIRHTHVCPIYDVGEENNMPFVVMAYVEGKSLADRLSGNRAFQDPQQAVRLVAEVATALDAVHAHGIIHRDLKPANILIDSAGHSILTDFGLARPEKDVEHLTMDGAVLGTPAYMAPEQANGELERIDARTDLYSLGVVLYQMLTGRVPFEGPPLKILSQITHDNPPTPSSMRTDLDPALETILLKAMARSLEDRYQSAKQFGAALNSWLTVQPLECGDLSPLSEMRTDSDRANSPVPAPAFAQDKSGDKSPHSKGRRILAFALAAAVVLFALGGVVYHISTDRGELVINCHDEAVEVTIKRNGKPVVEGLEVSHGQTNTTVRSGDIEVLIRGDHADDFTVTSNQGGQPKFVLSRDGKAVVEIERKLTVAASPSADGDPDRRAAEWVLSIGGTVDIRENGQERQTGAVGDLPRGAFELTVVALGPNPKVSDAGLAHFKDCKKLRHLDLNGAQVSDLGLAHFKDCNNLTYLNLNSTKVSDVGLAHFKDCNNLTYLNLDYTQVGDAGLANFKDCKNLIVLYLDNTKVSDAGLAHFRDCKNLTHLTLGSLQVSDAGLAHFKDCKNLTHLAVGGPQVSDAGLAHFKDFKNLTYLGLRGPRMSDAGLAHFKDCKNLASLDLRNTKVSDAGLAHFKDCKNLTTLLLNDTQVSDAGLERIAGCPKLVFVYVNNTKVTEAGVKKLSAALPGCKIEWDGGVIEPMVASADPDRRAAEWVLSIGGTISINENGKERQTGAVGDLPRGAFELTAVNLIHNPKVSDAGLVHFKDCKNLTSLTVDDTPVTDAGLAHFQDCKHLVYLHLYGPGVSDAGLAHFKDCNQLTALILGGTRVSDAGLAHFKGCKNLTYLRLSDGAQVSDAGLAHFKDCKNLTGLALGSTQVSDAGLAYFKDCKNLTTLNLDGTQVSDAGLAHFKDCKNLTGLNLAATAVSDAGLAHFGDCKNLTMLNLAGTELSDAGLAHFKDCKNLTGLHLGSTQVSDAALSDLARLPSLADLNLASTRISLRGHEQLKTAMPKCQITWSEPNRTVAKSVLALGGTVEIGPRDGSKSLSVKVAADLPGDYFQIRRVSLAGVAKPLDKLPEQLSLLRFPEFDRLESIDLSGITGLDYGFLVPIHSLRELSLANAGLNDESLAKLPKLPALKRLVLDGNDIRGTGLAHLSPGAPGELIDLSLGCPTLTDLFAKNLAELKRLKRLSLAGSGLSDAGIKHLAGLTNLESLDLRRTKASAAGIAELQKALPNCKIVWDGGGSESGKK